MEEITTWTGREAGFLQRALRLGVDEFAEKLDVSPRTVSYWKSKGVATKPRPFYQSVLDTVYDQLDEPAKRRFARLVADAEPSPPENDGDSDHPVAVDSGGAGSLISAIRTSTIDQIHMAAETYNAWNHRAGSYSAAPAANAQIAWGQTLIDLPCPPALRRDLYAGLAHLGLEAGFINFDAHVHDTAASVFAFAWRCAQESGDPHLQVKVLSHQARQAIYCNRSENALELLDRALRLPDTTATERAMLHTGRARAFAKLSRASETQTEIHRADTAFEHSNLASDRTWMRYYDQAQHLGDTGHALFDLAVEGRFATEALDRLDAAVTGHSVDYVRSRAMSLLKLASLRFAIGDPDHGVALASEGLPELSAVGSGRVAGLLHELLRYSLVHADRSAVSGVRAQINDLLT